MEYESQHIYSDPAVVEQMEKLADAGLAGAKDLVFERGKITIAHFDRVIVLDGVILGLSFTAARTGSASAAGISLVHHPHLLQAGWLCLMISILTALFFNLFTIIGIGFFGDMQYRELLSIHMTLVAAVIRRGGSENNDRLAALKQTHEELLSKTGSKLADYSKSSLKAAAICGVFSQLCTAAGLVLLAIHFMSLAY